MTDTRSLSTNNHNERGDLVTKYIIQRTDQWGGYVGRPGHKSSYVVDWRHARRFDTREEAEAQRCPGNEVVMQITAMV